MKTINYTGSSKIINRIVHLLNRKAPLPLDGDGDAVWGTNGQVLTTDGNGNTSWTTPQGGGGDVTDVEVNGVSVVDAQGVASVTVPTATSDLNNDSGFIDSTDLSTALGDYTPTANLATVATSGDYDDLLNKPSIPAAQVQSDWTQADNTQVDYIKNKPSLATVATSGSYTDLTDKPTIPTALSDLTDDSTHRVVTDTQISTWNGKSDFSGSYNDLTDKPTIPTVNDGTLTIQQNGTTLGTFTANQSGNTTVNLSGGGHVIEDQDGTDMTQRANLQFADAHLTDDSVNDRTEVEVIEEVTAQGWEDATEDGLYSVDGGSSFVPITGAEIGYDANTSINQKIDAVEGQIANSSDAYSSSKAYSVGDYCIYNDTLYRCVTACTAASWSVNSGCFVADTVVNALSRVTSVGISRNTSIVSDSAVTATLYGKILVVSGYFAVSGGVTGGTTLFTLDGVTTTGRFYTTCSKTNGAKYFAVMSNTSSTIKVDQTPASATTNGEYFEIALVATIQ